MKRAMKYTIIHAHLPTYLQATKKGKGQILATVTAITGMPSKLLIRTVKREQFLSGWKTPPKLSRPKLYTAETEAVLAFIWEQYDYPGAERFHPEIPKAVRIFVRE